MKRLCVMLFAASAAGSDLSSLEREMARVSKIAGGVVGASAVHVETGRRVSVRGSEPFPMASTFKVPVAVQLLTRVDKGEERLDRMVTISASDLSPGSGTLTDLFNKPGVALSVRNLLELMLLISDNTATDLLLRLAGGPDAVNARLRELGVDGIRVDRPTSHLIADYVGAALPPESVRTPELVRKALDEVTAEQRKAAGERFNADSRDTATPEGFVTLLERIQRKDILKPETGELLLDILRRCRSGEARLKGILPGGTVVAHKTGSIGGTTNDVGIMTLPGSAGHVAIVVFVKASEEEPARRERAIAEISRAVHDYFLFDPSGEPQRDYDAIAERIVSALKLRPGERVLTRFDPGHFVDLVTPLRRRIRQAEAVDVAALEYSGIGAGGPANKEAAIQSFVSLLDNADVYLWLPLRDSEREVTPAETIALQRWLDKGGVRREIHFHWSQGSVKGDGLGGAHSPTLDAIYQRALDIDYAALSRSQDSVATILRSGTVRVRTPAGTDLRFRIGNRPFNKQDGDASADRMKSARVRVDREIELPAGVLRVAPLEETAEGVMVIPEGRFGKVVARNIRLAIQAGRVTRVTADEHQSAVEAVLGTDESAKRFREFGLGFNPKLPGLAYFAYGAGAVRLSLGDNEELGGAVRGRFRRWFFFPDATVDVDGRELVRDGQLRLTH